MLSFTTLELFLTVLLLSGLRPSLEENADVPKSVTAVKGSCVLVPCKSPPYKELHWYKYQSSGYPTVYAKNTKEIIDQFRGRTSVPGNANEGDCTLRIDNIRQEDNVEVYVYFKRYEDKKTQINVLEAETRIAVQSSVEEGKIVNAFCTIRHSCPTSPPQIEWVGLETISNKVSNTKSEDGLWLAEASATFRPSSENHGRRISCNSSLSGTVVPAVNPVTLNVLYAPKNIKINYMRENVAEGGNITLECNSKSNPVPANYEWRVSPNNTIIHSKEKTITLRYVRRDTSVSCIASNTAGRGESEPLLLHVTYSPTILPDSFCSYQEENLRCVCQVEANPPADISWMVNESLVAFPHFNITTRQDGRRTVSELTGHSSQANITCNARNSRGESFHQMPVRSGLSEVRLGAAGAAAAALGIAGIAVTATVCYRKRRREVTSAEENVTFRNDKTTKLHHEYKCDLDQEIYVNEGHQAKVRAQTQKDPDIYENFSY